MTSSIPHPAQGALHGVAIVGMGACMPDAPDVATFWRNILAGHVAIGDVPEHRWRADIYYSQDRTLMDRTYSRVGGFIRYDPFNAKRFRIVPKSLPAIDDVQKLALVAVAEALAHAGYEVFAKDGSGKPFARDRCAVIMGNTLGGEYVDRTALRVWLPEIETALRESAIAQNKSPAEIDAWVAHFREHFEKQLPKVTEDSMTGELPNCITGRIANVFDLWGPNFATDAACASSMAALAAGVQGLLAHEYDVALIGGSDRSMDPPTYVKFSRIGALSPDHSAPFDASANGFVMGEGAGVLVLRRLEDAIADGDTIYSVIRGFGASSDGRGKGMTAPNPRGQRLAIERAWRNAGLPLHSVGLLEAHGTSTPVGDALEAEVITSLLEESGHTGAPVPMGSVKSMIGHLKSASGVASLIKTTLALHHGVLPPSAGFVAAKPDSPLMRNKVAINTQARPWVSGAQPRRAGVSSFGFGGTNSHVVLEAYSQDLANAHSAAPKTPGTVSISVPKSEPIAALSAEVVRLFAEHTGYSEAELDLDHNLEADLGIDSIKQAEVLALLRQTYGIEEDGALRLSDLATLRDTIAYVQNRAKAAAPAAPSPAPAQPPTPEPAQALAVASLRAAASSVAAAQAEAVQSIPGAAQVLAFGGATLDAAMQAGVTALSSITSLAELPPVDAQALARMPARVALVADDASEACRRLGDATGKSARLLAARGIFTATGAAIAQGHEVAFLFPGQGSQYLGMLRDLAQTYPVVAQTFAQADAILAPLLGETLTALVWPEVADDAADIRLRETQICQPAMLTADVALCRLLAEFGVTPNRVAGHSLGEYAAAVAAGVMTFADALYAVSARGREMADVKVEDPGKMAMVACDVARVEAVLRKAQGYVIAANKNCHTQTVIAGNSAAVDEVLAEFAVQGIEARQIPVSHAFHSAIVAPAAEPLRRVLQNITVQAAKIPLCANVHADYFPAEPDAIVDLLARQLASPVQFIDQVERLYADNVRVFVEVGPKRALTGFVRNILGDRPHRANACNHGKKPGVTGVLELLAALVVDGVPLSLGQDAMALANPNAQVQATSPSAAAPAAQKHSQPSSLARRTPERAPAAADNLVISGMAVALPRGPNDAGLNAEPFAALLEGQNLIESLDAAERDTIVDLNVTRFDKDGGRFVSIGGRDDVIRLAGKLAPLDLADYGIDPQLVAALDATGKLSVAMSIDALRDAGLPLVRRMRTTSTGTALFDRWGLPPQIAARTGVILASAFPGFDAVAEEMQRYYAQAEGAQPYAFDRRWIFRALAMGHAQVAQILMAQGPNTQINAACASGSQAIGVASDWLRQDRCDRVIVITADNVSTQASLPWLGAGFLAVGSASIDSDVSQAAVPFGRGRNGMIIGSGAAAFVVEKEAHVAERGMVPIAQVLAADFANSAFHGTRLDAAFIGEFMEKTVAKVSAACKVSVADLAPRTVFMSHETYTPARGGSSAAEVQGLRHVFGDATHHVTVANTKGFTGHPMGASLEDAAAIKGLQRQTLPPVANLDDIDPAFADLTFSRGGAKTFDVAIRFAAGFGSQVATTAYARRATQEARLVDAARYAAWCAQLGLPKTAGLAVVNRTLRLLEEGGVQVTELGEPSLAATTGSGPFDTVVGAAVVVDQVSHAAMPPHESAAAVPRAETVSGQTVSPAGSMAEAPSPAGDEDTLLQQITELFAEQTGYDLADLAPSHALEADLGIDSVKQAEIFAMMRERFALKADDNFRISELQTLAAAANYVRAWRQHEPPAAPAPKQDAAPAQASVAEVKSSAPAPAATSAAPTVTLPELTQQIVALFAEETGYPPEDLAIDAALEGDLGIDSIKQAEIVARLRDRFAIAPDPDFSFNAVQTIEALALYVHSRKGAADVAASSAEDLSAPAQAVPQSLESPPTGAKAASTPMPATPAAAEPSAASTTPSHAEVVTELTQMFAEQTGYDVADLDPEHALEADLGIDSVKQAEVFALMRGHYAMPADENFRLGEVQTVNALATYVMAWRRDAAVSARPAAAPDPKTPPPPSSPTPPAAAQAVPESDNEGEALGFAARAVGLLPLPERPAAPNASPRGTVWLLGTADSASLDAAQSALASCGAQVVPITAATDLTQLAAADALVMVVDDLAADADPMGPCHALFAVARHLAALPNQPSYLQVIGRHGAGFGLVPSGATAGASPDDITVQRVQAAAMAALSGMVKSLAVEWPQTLCRTIDIIHAAGAAVPWPRAIAEGLALWGGDVATAPREVVVTVDQGEAHYHTLTRHIGATPAKPRPLPHHGKVVVTGGARGVTYALLMALAQRRPLDITILARTGPTSPERSPLTGHDETQAREVAKAALTAAGVRVTPAAVRAWVSAEQVRLDIWHNLAALEAIGCRVKLIPCDVADPEARARAAAQIRQDNKPVALLLHGAGIEESRFLRDKDAEALARTAAPKASALWHLLALLAPQRTVTMGSISGRFGNGGQVDYAAANELMAGVARVASDPILNLAWTAWDDVGMATRGSVRQVLTGLGVALMPERVGVALGAALIESETVGDFVVAGDLGSVAAAERPWPALFTASRVLPADAATGCTGGICLSRRLDARKDLGLDDHRIDGVPYLPGVLGIELMQQAAQSLLGRDVTHLQNVAFRVPVKLFFDRPLLIQVEVRQFAHALHVCIVSERPAPSGQLQRKTHFTCEVPLAPKAMPAWQEDPPEYHLAGAAPRALQRDDIYARYFHGPSFQVLDHAPTLHDLGVHARAIEPATPWLAGTQQAACATLPWAREAGFQAAGLWEMAYRQRMGLPSAIEDLWLSGAAADQASAGQPQGSAEAMPYVVTVHPIDAQAEGCTFDIVTRRLDGPDGAPGTVVDIMRGYRSIALRALKAPEQIPVIGPGASLPVLADVARASLNLGEVVPLLQLHADAAVNLLLSPAERAHWATLTVRKRRLEWLAGRLVAKRLIRATWAREGAPAAADAIAIMADGAGAPQVAIASRSPQGPMPHLSVSHGAGVAVALVSWQANQLPGIDVEEVATRVPAFATTYFTEKEQQVASQSANPAQTLTAMWALKEATGKALGLGTRLDYLGIEALPSDPTIDASINSTWQIASTAKSAQMLAGRSLSTAHVAVDMQPHIVRAEVVLAALDDAANSPHPDARGHVPARRKPEMNA